MSDIDIVIKPTLSDYSALQLEFSHYTLHIAAILDEIY